MTSDSAQSYKASGFNNRIGWGNTPALLIIDLCKAYFTPGSPLDCSSYPPAAAVPSKISELLAAARKSGKPVIWTTCEYKDMSEAGVFYSKAKALKIWHIETQDGLKDFLPGLSPQGEEVLVKKTHPSAFFKTNLEETLRGLGVDTVVLCGVSTSGCVRATAMDAMCLDFRPMIVGEGCGDRGERVQEGNLFDLDAKVGDVVGLGEAVGRLGG